MAGIKSSHTAFHAQQSADLLSWAHATNPASWHELAKAGDFADLRSGIDLLITGFWITQQPSCDRATAMLFLAKAVQAGFLNSPPIQHDARATRSFCIWLHRQIDEARFASADFSLSDDDWKLIRKHCSKKFDMALPAEMLKPTQAASTVAAGKRDYWALFRPADREFSSVQAA